MTKAKYLVFDTETTGVDTRNDRIVQLFIGIADGEGNLTDTWEWNINPGIEIPDAASDVHGFTNEYLEEFGRHPGDALGEALEVFDNHAHLIWVAYNLNFDMSLLDSEFRRHGSDSDFAQTALDMEIELFDPIVVDRAKDKYRKGNRKLATVAKHYGLAFDEDSLHDAQADVELTAKVAVAVEKKFGIPDVATQANMHRLWARGLTEYFRKSGKREEDGSPIVVEESWPVR